MGKFGSSFLLNRLVGISTAKQTFAKHVEIPTSTTRIERKLGNSISKLLFGRK